MKFHQSFCVVDQDMRILWIGGDREAFSSETGTLTALPDRALATRLTDHIADPGTAEAITAMVRGVARTGRRLRFDYRCDQPGVIRRFRLTVEPMRSGRIMLIHDLRDARMLRAPLLPWQLDATAPDAKCSLCAAVRPARGAWTAVEQLRRPHPARVAQAVCPACHGRVDEALASLHDEAVMGAPAAPGV